MLNFFAILLIFFIFLLLLILKKRTIKNLIKIKRLNPKKFLKNKIYIPKKNSFLYVHEYEKYSKLYRNALRDKMIKLFQGSTDDKLKALKIAKDLGDKSTLPILRKGLRDTSPKIVEISAQLIRKFK